MVLESSVKPIWQPWLGLTEDSGTTDSGCFGVGWVVTTNGLKDSSMSLTDIITG